MDAELVAKSADCWISKPLGLGTSLGVESVKLGIGRIGVVS